MEVLQLMNEEELISKLSSVASPVVINDIKIGRVSQ